MFAGKLILCALIAVVLQCNSGEALGWTRAKNACIVSKNNKTIDLDLKAQDVTWRQCLRLCANDKRCLSVQWIDDKVHKPKCELKTANHWHGGFQKPCRPYPKSVTVKYSEKDHSFWLEPSTSCSRPAYETGHVASGVSLELGQEFCDKIEGCRAVGCLKTKEQLCFTLSPHKRRPKDVPWCDHQKMPANALYSQKQMINMG